MIKKEKVISFVWQHILLLVSLYVMTFGVAACVRSQLGSSVISTIPYVMASGDATGEEIVKLCETIQEDVKQKFGIEIHPEVNVK